MYLILIRQGIPDVLVHCPLFPLHELHKVPPLLLTFIDKKLNLLIRAPNVSSLATDTVPVLTPPLCLDGAGPNGKCSSSMMVFHIPPCQKTFPAWRNVKYRQGRGTKCSYTNRGPFPSQNYSTIFQRRASFCLAFATVYRSNCHLWLVQYFFSPCIFT